MKVSVILPIYNGEKTLETTLKSLIAQTFQDFELIACIDGTKDRCKQILQTYKSSFQKLTILENEKNLGLGPTMNRLVAATDGEYIAIAEQDDYYYPDRLQVQVDVLDKRANIGLVSGIAEFWNGKQITGKFPGMLVNKKEYPEREEMFLLNYKKQIKVVNSCMMFRKSIHINNGLYFTKHYPSISVDWAYILRFSLVSKIHGLHKVLVRLDRRPDRNSVTSNKEKQFAATRELLQNFAYEYPEIISRKDYMFALTTQHLMELSNLKPLNFASAFVKFYLKNPNDRRWFPYIKHKFRRYLSK